MNYLIFKMECKITGLSLIFKIKAGKILNTRSFPSLVGERTKGWGIKIDVGCWMLDILPRPSILK